MSVHPSRATTTLLAFAESVAASLPAGHGWAQACAIGRREWTEPGGRQRDHERAELRRAWLRAGGSVVYLSRPDSRGPGLPVLAYAVDATHDGRTVWATHLGLAVQVSGDVARIL